MKMIRDINEYKELAVNDCVLRTEIKEVLNEIGEKHSIRPHMRTFTDYYRYRGETYNTQDILRMENEFGLKMGHCGKGNSPWIDFKWHEAKEPKNELFKKLKQLIHDWEENADKVIEVRGESAYTDMYILGKIHDVELPIKENWGFLIRESGVRENLFSIEEIIAIENETNATFRYRDTYGYHFVWNLPAIKMDLEENR